MLKVLVSFFLALFGFTRKAEATHVDDSTVAEDPEGFLRIEDWTPHEEPTALVDKNSTKKKANKKKAKKKKKAAKRARRRNRV